MKYASSHNLNVGAVLPDLAGLLAVPTEGQEVLASRHVRGDLCACWCVEGYVSRVRACAGQQEEVEYAKYVRAHAIQVRFSQVRVRACTRGGSGECACKWTV